MPSVYGPRGVAYHRKGDEAHAVEDYSERLKAEPDDVGTLLNRGDALRNMHEMSRAGADYSEAIRLAPGNPGGWKGRGFIRLSTQDFDGAVADFSEAIRLSPNEGSVYLNRGAALALHQPERPRAWPMKIWRSVSIPNHPLGYVNRAQTLDNLGDQIAAIASIDKALQLAPGFPPAVDLQKKIGERPKRRQAAADLSPEAANRNYQRCAFPVTDVGPGKEEMTRSSTPAPR